LVGSACSSWLRDAIDDPERIDHRAADAADHARWRAARRRYAAAVHDAIRIFGQALAAVHAELDWQLLGRSYAEGDAARFFEDALRKRIVDTGLAIADDLAGALPRGGPGRSLYFGAAVAELAPILVERLVLGREVVWLNLAGEESAELARALAAVGARLGVELPEPSDAPLESQRRAAFDHLWMVSVLTDPDAFPALHDELYGRRGGPLGTGRGRPKRERGRAGAIATALLARAAPPCLLSTTDEELQVLLPLARESGLSLNVPADGRVTAIVGDVVRHCRLSRAPERPRRRAARHRPHG
jgi:hypothetical protein